MINQEVKPKDLSSRTARYLTLEGLLAALLEKFHLAQAATVNFEGHLLISDLVIYL